MEAIEIRGIVRDMFEQGDTALAMWLARQHEETIKIANGVASLVGLPVLQVYTKHGLSETVYRRPVSMDSRVIQRAIDDVVTAGGGYVYIPDGLYR